MKLTTGIIHDFYAKASMLEKDDAVKLSGEIRFKIGLNLNRMREIAAVYELSRNRSMADIYKANRELEPKDRRSDPELQADFMDMNAKLRAIEHDLNLKTILKGDLRLDDNPKIGGSVIEVLIPFMDGIE